MLLRPSRPTTAACCNSARKIDLGSAYVQALAGGSVQYQNASIVGGFLRGPGTAWPFSRRDEHFERHNGQHRRGGPADGTTSFTEVTNRGQFANNALLTWNAGINDGGATLTVNNTATVSEWSNAGVIVISNSGVLNNHETDLTSYGGGRITVNSGGTFNVDSPGEGVALDLQDSLLVNNGKLTGTTNVDYGATVKGGGTFGAINVFDGGTLAISPSGSPQASFLEVSGGSLAGTGQFAQSATVDGAALVVPNPTDRLVLSGDLTGDGPVTKLGAGTVVLAGDNTYLGGTTITDGTLIVANRGSLADETNLMIGAGGTLIYDPSAAAPFAVSPSAVAVPEPATPVLLAVAAILGGWMTRRRRIGR